MKKIIANVLKWTAENKMLFIFLTFILLLSTCQKEQSCKTCTETVVFFDAPNHHTSTYISKQETFCNGSQWTDLGTKPPKKWSSDGGHTISSETVTRECK